jgi:hypothetical protein
LLDDIVERAEFPLALNKFEGDAALLYADVGDNAQAAARDIANQIFALFPALKTKAGELSTARATCPCGACQNIRDLRLKAIVHMGEAAFRKIRQFDEMAGEDVIVVHRLLKNNVRASEYVLMTEAFFSHLDSSFVAAGQPMAESYEHLGTVNLRAFPIAGALPLREAEARGGSWWRRLWS